MKKIFVILILFVLPACTAFGQMIVKSSTDSELMRVAESGDVGIGTSAPAEKLHVNGDVALGNAETAGTDQELYVVQRPTEGVGYALTIRAGRGRGVGSANIGGNLILQGGRTGDTMPPYNYGHVILQPSAPDNTGRVGIGTTAPIERLDVNGAIHLGTTNNTNDGAIRFTGEDFEGRLKDTWVSLTQGGGTSLWSQNGDDIYRYSTTGQVGVGTSTPTAELEVMNTVYSSTNDLLRVRKNAGGFPGDIIHDRFVVKEDGKVGIGTASPSEQLSIIKATNATLGLYTSTSMYGQTGALFSSDANGHLTVNAMYTLGVNPTEPRNILLATNGSPTTALVGIGTSAPIERLDVNGAIRLANTSNTSPGNAGTIRWTGTDFEGNMGGGTWTSLTQSGGTSLWSQNGTSIYYNTGNVGVGITAPQQKLAVLSSATNQFGIYKEFNPPFYRRGAQFFINTNNDLQIFAREEYQDSMTPKNIILTNADETGSVGIGVLNPIAKLDVVDPMAAGTDDLFMVREYTPGSPFPIIFTRFAVKNDGYVGINTHATPYILTVDGPAMLHNVQNPPKPNSGYAGIYTSSGELYAMDEAGNSTQLSPHDAKTGDWVFYSKNVNTGRVVKVNMEKLVKKIEELTGEQFMEEFFDQE